jgi:hypothetical protein
VKGARHGDESALTIISLGIVREKSKPRGTGKSGRECGREYGREYGHEWVWEWDDGDDHGEEV